MAKILLIEDEPVAADLAEQWLTAERHIVEVANTGSLGLEHMLMSAYDLILLDWDLPDVSGFELLKKYRTSGGTSPVIMLTAKSNPEDKEITLDGGADDYVTKPYSLKELSARIRVQLRKSLGQQTNELSARGIVLIPDQLRVTMAGKAIDLMPRDFSLLEFFMRNPDRVFTAEAVLARVWDADSDANTSAFRSALKRLRQKLNSDDEQIPLIETIHGAGYRFNSH